MNDDQQTRARFQSILAGVGETFGRQLSTAAIGGYWIGLADLDLPTFEAAIAKALRTSEFMPSVAEIRKHAGDQDEGTRATLAWGEFLGAVPLGPYKHVDFGDGVINATVRLMGGWPDVLGRLSSAESEKWLRIEFEKTYQRLCSAGVDGEAARPLPGLNEGEVRGGVVCLPAPVKIRTDQTPIGITQRERPRVEFRKP